MKEFTVSAGIILDNEKILCVQRDKGKYEYISYKFEFPGGKIEPGEDGKQALKRELMEEMRLDISIDDMEFLTTVHHQYPDFKITMHAYLCPQESPEFTLLEHIDYKWLFKHQLRELDWAEADLPIVSTLIER